jgi:hypothetical protein
MKLRWSRVVWLAVLTCVSCAKPYQAPKENEPAAVVKLKFDYNRNAASGVLPANPGSPGIGVRVNLGIAKETYVAYERNYPMTTPEGRSDLEIDSIRVHPGTPLTIGAQLSVTWTTTQVETVTRHRTEYKERIRYDNVYDYASKSMKVVQVREQITVDVPYTVTEPVTRLHAQGCNTSAQLLPEKDAVYLLDYSTPAVETGCAVKLYRQVSTGGGNFKLEPLGS